MNQQNILEKKLLIRNQLGLHARPAALLVETANRFQSEITIQKGKHKVNAKSIMGVLMLAAGPSSRVTIRIIGSDAEAAMAAIEKLIDQNFGEKT